jgi:hypothetical protein
MALFGTEIILHLLWKGLLVLGSVECLVLRINIHSLVPLWVWSQLPKRIEEMCSNETHTRHRSPASIVFEQSLSRYFHREQQAFLPWILLVNQSSHHTVHMIKHLIVHSDHIVECDCIPLWFPQGPILKWHQYFHDVLHNGPFIFWTVACNQRIWDFGAIRLWIPLIGCHAPTPPVLRSKVSSHP